MDYTTNNLSDFFLLLDAQYLVDAGIIDCRLCQSLKAQSDALFFENCSCKPFL